MLGRKSNTNARRILLVLAMALAYGAAMCPMKEVARLFYTPPTEMAGDLDSLSQQFHQMIEEDGGSATTPDTFVDSKIDHFDASNSKTFKQRYFVNRNWYDAGRQIHILVLGNQQVIAPEMTTVEALPWVANARSLNATVWALEHRFWGKSLTTTKRPTTAVELALLTATQAVEDTADFIRTQNKASGESAPKWILYGEGYAASVALWLRQKYPALTAGVIASSPFPHPSGNFYQYPKNVEDAYGAYDPTCLANIRKSALAIRHAMQSAAGRAKLDAAFHLAPPFGTNLTYDDQQFFYFVLHGFLLFPVQHNRLNVPIFAKGGGIPEACAIFNNASVSDPIEKFANLIKYDLFVLSTFLTPPHTGGGATVTPNWFVPNNVTMFSQYTRVIDGLKNIVWQTFCNEFALFITTDASNDIAFGANLPRGFLVNFCANTFGRQITIDSIDANIKRIRNTWALGDVYAGTNAVITYGSVDPARNGSYTAVADKSSAYFIMDGAARAAEWQPPSPNDLGTVKFARDLILSKIKAWTGTVTTNSNKAREGNVKLENVREAVVADKKEIAEEKTSSKRREIQNWNNVEVEYNVPRRARKVTKRGRRPLAEHPRVKLSFARHLRKRFANYKPKKSGGANKPDDVSTVAYSRITQQLDHFNTSNTATWKQYFYYNPQNAKTGGPNFLMLGGEAPLDEFLVSDELAYYHWAKTYGASIYALEHRFYGDSQPFDDLSTEHLHYLSSEQALADAAAFIKKINADRKLTKPKWIVFGGSYPGSLAAWMRLKYPELVYGAVASSAPVEAKTDYWEYLNVVDNVTRTLAPKSCFKTVHRFFEWSHTQLTTIQGRKKFSKSMNLCDAWDQAYVDEKDALLLLESLVFDFAEYVQYDDAHHENLKGICDAFKDFDTEVGADNADSEREYARFVEFAKQLLNGHNFAAAAKANSPRHRRHHHVKKANIATSRMHRDYSDYNGGSGAGNDSSSSSSSTSDADRCSNFDYAEYVDYIQQPNNFDSSDRCWIWQTCTELGVAMSSDFGYNLFESTMPVNLDVDLCRDVFGADINREYLDRSVRFSNNYYGGKDKYNGTRVVFANGSEDPWHTMSVYAPLQSSSVTSLLIPGTSHCYDMFANQHSDTKSLKWARKQIATIIGTWVNAK